MKKIITAINNPNLNEKLKQENNLEIICKDIQYKEAILEILLENKNVDILIINNDLPGEIQTEKLLNEIKVINNKIKIIFILEKENKKIEENLKKLNINNIYYNSEINIKKLIKIINEENNSNNEIKKEVKELNEIISKNNKIKKEKTNKIITLFGPSNVGKTITIINIAKILENKYKKILIIDFDLNKPNINNFLGIKKTIKNNFVKINNLENIKNNFVKINNLENIKNNLNKLLIKYNKKIEIISGLKNYFNNQINNIEKINLNIFEIFKYLKNIYDFILIDIGTENKKEINNILIKNSDLNFLLIEGNLIGINKAKILINNLYDKNNFNLIINKKDKYCVDLKILNIIFENKNKIQIVKYNKYFSNLINKNFKNIYLNKKINLEKIYKNIINKIII